MAEKDDDDTTLQYAFDEAVRKVSETTQILPVDIQLQFYAYYKHAIEEPIRQNDMDEKNASLRNAFKLNAWVQAGNMSSREAKKKYIDLANLHIKSGS